MKTAALVLSLMAFPALATIGGMPSPISNMVKMDFYVCLDAKGHPIAQSEKLKQNKQCTQTGNVKIDKINKM